MSLLTVDALVTRYGTVEAVKGVSLGLEEGEIVALVGANGAGKTTTLLSLSGVLKPAGGHIHFRGQSIAGQPTHRVVRQGIGQVVEGRGIFATLSVLDNLRLGAYFRRRSEADPDIARILQRFPRLGERRHVPAGALSGGEQQILAIARAMLSRPALLLMDEPSMGLAPMVVEEVFRLIAEINRAGTTIFLVEQNAARALSISQRAYVMANGRIVAEGSSEKLLNDPELRHAYLGLPVT